MKRFLAFILAAVLMVGCLSACDGKKSPSDGIITVFSHDVEKFDGADHDSVWKYIEEKCDAQIEISGVPFNSYNEKINLMVNNFESPDIFFYLPENSDSYYKWAKDDLMINLDDYVKDDSKYPNIYNLINSERYKNLTYDGKHTLVPRLAVSCNWGIYIRQDWLDNLGMQQPKTLEELYDVLYAFTFNDPDGNGKNDTYGIGGSVDYFWFMPIYAAFQAKPDWNYSADQSTMEYMTFTEEFREFIRYMKKCYDAGTIIKDFYTKTDDMKIEDFASGKVGILIHNGGEHVQNVMQKTSQASPHAKIDVLDMFEGPAGQNIHGWGGWWGGYSISADCSDIDAALRVLDYLVGEEGSMTRIYGIEGIHYTNDNGTLSITAENAENRKNEGADRFSVIKENGEELPYGSYAWGPWFGSLRKFHSDGAIETYDDYSFYQWNSLAEKINDNNNRHVKESDMVNISINDKEFYSIMNALDDLASTYIINAIVGEKNADGDWDSYLKDADSKGYADARKKAYDTMKKLGK